MDIMEEIEECKKPLLIVSDSMHNADMYYLTRFLFNDPFVYLSMPHKGKDMLIVPQMEYERAKKESIVKEIRSTRDYGYALKLEELILRILSLEGVNEIEVPGYFSLYSADRLRAEGIEVVPVEELKMTKRREIKTEQELKYVRKAQRACEHAMGIAIERIKNSSVQGNLLVLNDEILTSERLKADIEHDLIDHGCKCDAGEPIVSCGKKAANPHFSGHGALSAYEAIIIDIFPRLKTERYFADMTRTVVKGEPGNELKEMYAAVKQAQDAALGIVKEGVTCKEVHNLVCDIFEDRGYDTIRGNGNSGFIHTTGHGVGLDIHETPNVGNNDYELRKGNVITIEPGLYEPEVGGVRLEDMALVQKNSCENLTKNEKKFVV